ncbi:MAG: polyribonucleotide nucleotidyltransferase [Elusimicrobia bacterium]|nr:polyribonucleotide nucleotidyltransferase [Elusimicrobiota bacterium]
MNKNDIIHFEEKVGRDLISLETGLLAKQASGAVVIRLGDTMVLSTCVQAKKPRTDPPEFVPLTVEYKERTYAAGKIPGGFFKREGKPREKEILSGRLSDRSIRPLFPEYFNTETQVTSMVLSSDGSADPDVLAINSASAALMISDIPFNGPVGAVRIAKLNEDYIINPTFEERKNADMELVISGTKEGILMVEGGGKEIPNEELIKAMETAKKEIDALCNVQIKLAKTCGKTKTEVIRPVIREEISEEVKKIEKEVEEYLNTFPEKKAMEAKFASIQESLISKFKELFPEDETVSYQVKTVMEEVIYKVSRELVLSKRVRADGRKTDEIRPISIIPGYLPRTHGSALFTRGQTQTIATTTLGTQEDQQILDDLEGKATDRFMLHYNFPGFSTGETKPDRGPSRREIGHGNLAKRALSYLLPTEEEFPYTIRIVSDILESNGSSSMATVCGGSLSMFDAGVPMKAPCAGIAMGLITDKDRYAVLSDIAGLEDHFGDMDFKLAGTDKGITAFQMDVKLSSGIPFNILKEAIEQAARGRNHILSLMNKALPQPRKEVSQFAPKMIKLAIPKDKIGAFIGPGGKNIKALIERTKANIEVNDDGMVFISGQDSEGIKEAQRVVEGYSKDVEVGQVYKGRVVEIKDFGAFVEVLPGKEGLLHISEVDVHRIRKVEDVLNIGDEVEVKVVDMDNTGKFKLSRKVLLQNKK